MFEIWLLGYNIHTVYFSSIKKRDDARFVFNPKIPTWFYHLNLAKKLIAEFRVTRSFMGLSKMMRKTTLDKRVLKNVGNDHNEGNAYNNY